VSYFQAEARRVRDIARTLLQDRPCLIMLRRFEATLTEQRLDFDYRIRSGVSTQRLGMKVLEKEGVLDLLASVRASRILEDHPAPGA
jgi:hypothetical protein